MRAVQVKGFGDVDQLELVELPDPEPQAGQVRIRVEASGLNYADVMQRAGLYPGGPKPPYISGLEAAGVVEAGEGLPVGARVMAVSAGGCHADRVRSELELGETVSSLLVRRSGQLFAGHKKLIYKRMTFEDGCSGFLAYDADLNRRFPVVQRLKARRHQNGIAY